MAKLTLKQVQEALDYYGGSAREISSKAPIFLELAQALLESQEALRKLAAYCERIGLSNDYTHAAKKALLPSGEDESMPLGTALPTPRLAGS